MTKTKHRPLRADDQSVVVAFPLRGEWRAPHTPAHRVPSHGSHLWAQTYAYDFWRTHPNHPSRFHNRSTLRYWTRGVHLPECLGYGQTVHAAFDGTVIRAADDLIDRDHLHPVLDLARVIRNSLALNSRADPWAMVGNHAVVAHDTIDDCYALYAHLGHHSLRVSAGGHIRTGATIGEVGHTGNSTAPHLHFQLMTTPDPRTATGIPCVFDDLEHHQDGVWATSPHAIPGLHQRVRNR